MDWGKFGSVIVSMNQKWDCISLTEAEARKLAKLLIEHADAIARASKPSPALPAQATAQYRDEAKLKPSKQGVNEHDDD